MTNTQESAPAIASPAGHSITLPCPCCGEEKAAISVALWMLGDDGENAFTCNECNSEFSAGTVRSMIRRWTKFLAWLDTAPEEEE